MPWRNTSLLSQVWPGVRKYRQPSCGWGNRTGIMPTGFAAGCPERNGCASAGANWDKKIWPAEKYAVLVQNLVGKYDALVLLGNKADNAQAEQVARGAPFPCINLCGQTILLEAAAVMERMTLFIGNDSGLGHIASAVNTASFTLFGPGNPERYHPWGEQARWYAAPDWLMENIPVDVVVNKIKESPPATHI